MTRAVLQTARSVERGVQYYGPDVNTVATMADKWLDNNGKAGDKFNIFEETLVRVVAFNDVTALVETAPVSGPTASLVTGPVLQHAFIQGSGLHCDKCGSTKESHPKESHPKC